MSVVIHDHFDGSAHCVECGGFCKLTGHDHAVTAFIRFAVESLAYQGYQTMPMMWVDPLRELGLDPRKLLARAIETTGKMPR